MASKHAGHSLGAVFPASGCTPGVCLRVAEVTTQVIGPKRGRSIYDPSAMSPTLSTVVTVAPKVWQAATFTREHVWPWLREPSKVLERFFPARKEERLLREIRATAEAFRPEDSVRIFLIASPAHPHAVSLSLYGDVTLGVLVVNVAPFALRLVEIEHMRIASRACGCEIRNRPLVCDFLVTGQSHQINVKEPLEWDTAGAPKVGEAIALDVSGSLKLCGPWSREYVEVPFKSDIWIRVRE